MTPEDTQFEDRLRRGLSRLADGAGPGPTPEAVSRRLRRPTLLRRAGAGGALALAAVAMLLFSMPRPQPADEPKQAAADRAALRADAALRAEIARLEARADARIAEARHLLVIAAAHRRRDECLRQLARLDTAERIARQAEETAFIIVYDADLLREQPGRIQSAVAGYREAVRLFPQTKWAEVARKKLAQIDRPRRKGNPS